MSTQLNKAMQSYFSNSSSNLVECDYLADARSSVTSMSQAGVSAYMGNLYRARLGGTCGVDDDWYMVVYVPSYADTGKVYCLVEGMLFCRDGAGQMKLRYGVSDDQDTSSGEEVSSIPFNGVVGNQSELTVHRYISSDAVGLPSDLGSTSFYADVGNFGPSENNLEGISEDTPLIMQGGSYYIVQCSNEWFQEQRMTMDFTWMELDGSFFTDEFLEGVS